ESALRQRLEVLRGTQSKPTDGDGPNEENAAAVICDPDIKGKKGKQSPIRGELERVEKLLARLPALPGAESKLEGFTRGVQELVSKMPDLKLLIFTEYRATQDVLTATLAGLFGEESVETIHGSKKLDERKAVVRRFNEQDRPRFLVSTAAGG